MKNEKENTERLANPVSLFFFVSRAVVSRLLPILLPAGFPYQAFVGKPPEVIVTAQAVTVQGRSMAYPVPCLIAVEVPVEDRAEEAEEDIAC